MNNTKIPFYLLLVAVVSLLGVAESQAQPNFQELGKWVPETANCLIMVQSEKIFDSPLAKKENWQTDRSAAFRSGASFFPPSTKRILIASQIDFEFLDSVYHVGAFEKSGPAINITDVSKRINGNIETIEGKDALELPNNSYLIKIDDSTLVTMTPASRQLTTRWLRKKLTGSMDVSPYLTKAVKFADQNAHVIIALDLDGVLDEKEINKRLKDNKTLNEAMADLHSKTLSSIAGITLGITVTDKITGAINIDFNQDPSSLTAVSKTVLIAALKKNGLMIDDIESWTVTNKGNQLRFIGPMSRESLRDVGSLIQQPIVDDLSGASESSSLTSEVDMKTKTIQYFGDVEHVLVMIRRKNLGQLDSYSKWFDRYARQIDGISVLGVDPVMVEYGTYVANSFRDISGGLNTSNLAKNKSVAGQGFSNAGGGRWSYGYGYGTINGRNYTRDSRRAASAIGTEAGANDAKTIMRELDSETAKIKRAMSEKYNMNF